VKIGWLGFIVTVTTSRLHFMPLKIPPLKWPILCWVGR